MLKSVIQNIASVYSELPRSHITDSIYFGDGYSTEEAKEIFSDIRRLQRWMDVEVALADAQAELGIIPNAAALEISKKGKIEYLNLFYVQEQIAITKHSLIPLLKAWQNIISEDNAQYLHFGATTQDIQDTAQVLELKEVIIILERDLKEIINNLADIASKHKSLVMAGRTHAQHALPITLGGKVAIWIDECLRNYDRLVACKKNVLISQLFGGVGSMASFQKDGFKLLEVFSNKLGLGTPETCWHSSRDRFVEYLTVLAMITGTLGKIANEIIQLSKDEIAELMEPINDGQIGSSTMPHKRNPEICERIFTLSKLVKGHASLSFDSLIAEHERDYRSVRLEWVTLTDSSMYSCCALKLMNSVLKGLVVNESNITRNLENSAEILSSESIRFSLSEKFNKKKAFDYVYKASMQAAKNKMSLTDELLNISEVAENFSRDVIVKMTNPRNYVGLSETISDRMIFKSISKFSLSDSISINYADDKTIIIHYKDKQEGFNGWLVFDDVNYSLSAGGMRVQKGLTSQMLVAMAKNMTKKMRLCGLPVNGAKSGIDYDPLSPNKRAAMSRFIKAISPFMEARYSMGSDLNTTMDELEIIAKNLGMPSVKMAIAKKQNYEKNYFLKRIDLLDQSAIGDWTLGKIRAGYVVGASAIRVNDYLKLDKSKSIISVQGFGVLAKAAIITLLNEGFNIQAISDAKKCIISTTNKGLPVREWLNEKGGLLPDLKPSNDYQVFDKEAIYEFPADLMILAAIENAVTINNIHLIRAKAIIPGANLAITNDADQALYTKNVITIPSFVAGCGGCMSMNGLFGPEDHPTASQVLEYMRKKTFSLIDEILLISKQRNIAPTIAAELLIEEVNLPYRSNPYKV